MKNCTYLNKYQTFIFIVQKKRIFLGIFNNGIRKALITVFTLFLIVLLNFKVNAQDSVISDGLVGRWEFNDGSGQDLSDIGNDAVLNEKSIYSLAKGQNCIQLMPNTGPVKIPVKKNSTLAISRGTICFWLNAGWKDGTFLSFNNDAVQLNVYRGDFMVRFSGENEFRYWNGILDYDWPKYDMREWAFYGNPRAAVNDQEWHHFAVSYDDEGKRIIGWRDGELIAVIDLSTVKTEPLKQEGLTEITLGGNFAGFMDDVRIYNKVLTDTYVRDIYNSDKSTFEGRYDTNEYPGTPQTSYKFKRGDEKLYQAWLQYNAVSNSSVKDFLTNIIAEGSNSTVQTAAAELKNSVKTMLGITPEIKEISTSGSKVIIGTAKTSGWIAKNADKIGLERIKNDGFIIKTIHSENADVLVVAGAIPAGVCFGTFDLIRRIQMGQNFSDIDILENPEIPIRMINHWSFFRGFYSDKWQGGRYNSLFSWKELANGNTMIIRDWARMMASAGWNAICPSEVNWNFRDNFLNHLDEVEKLADIFRDYGIKLYWSPSYILALDPATADSLYARVPDFGGYLMKLGSEKQNGDPRPPMVNRIADNLKPFGGNCLVRGFVYGNKRYTQYPYRNLIPYDIFVPEDGKYRDNVILVPKGSAGDWDLSAPIPAIDGGLKKTLRGSELVIDKDFPASWVEKWKWWLEQDTWRHGPGSLNKNTVDCILGVAMISPAASWTNSPLNMVNYYGLGRLAWNPDLTLDEIYTEWIQQTFGNDKQVIETIKNILYISDDAVRKTYMYRGYRGIWIGFDKNLVEDKTPYAIDREGIGPATPILKKRLLDQYNSGLRGIYGDPLRGEEFLSAFHFLPYDYRLSIGRTLIEDIYGNVAEAVDLGKLMEKLWGTLKDKIDKQRFDFVAQNLNDFVQELKETEIKDATAFEEHTGFKREDVLSGLTKEKLEAKQVYNVRFYGAAGDGIANDAPAINKAIDICSNAGGGTVFVPSGIYACGSIHLKSNITFVLDAGVRLKAMPGWMDNWEPNPNDRNLMDPAYYHVEASLIWGRNLENVKIYGPGTIDGSSLTKSSTVLNGIGDKAISLQLCKNVEIRNLNIKKGGHYAILLTGCNDVLVDNVNIKTDRDGIDLMQCSNTEINSCHIDAVRYQDGRPAGGDDAIKLGSDLSLGEAIPSSNITIKNCYLASGCNALQIGTETIASFSNIHVENITINKTGKAGIGITSNDGSVIENVFYKNIKMEKTFLPVFIKLSDVARVPKGTYRRGSIRNITFDNITATDCYSYFKNGEMASVIWGKPDTPIENIDFRNVSFTAKGGNPVAGSELKPTENDERFPANVGELPANVWYLRNVKGIRFIDCDFPFEKPDGKPAVVIDNSSNLLFDNTTIPVGTECSSRISIRGGASRDLTIQNCPGMGDRKLNIVTDEDF
ncbi:MAG TPA: glycosyl hydrolase family 28 protein [Draconibacterium sp.]|nr:glycosyl hydrolase family 28 protein [Draconibacterium sp.]